MASANNRGMSAQESQDLVREIQLRFDRGLSQTDTVLELNQGYFDPHIRRAPGDLGAIVRSCYSFMEKSRDAKVRFAQKETKAVALYEALIALGWTPPA